MPRVKPCIIPTWLARVRQPAGYQTIPMIGKILVSKIILSENPGKIMPPNRYWSCHQTVGAHCQRWRYQQAGSTDGSGTVLRTWSVRMWRGPHTYETVPDPPICKSTYHKRHGNTSSSSWLVVFTIKCIHVSTLLQRISDI